MYYAHTHSWHFFDPMLESEGGWFERSTLGKPGFFVFGKLIGPEDYEGHLEFIGGNQYGAEGGPGGSVGAWYYNGDSGPINECGER